MAQQEHGAGQPFRPVIGHSRRQDLSDWSKQTLGAGNMKAAVQLPRGEDLHEWLAVNTVDFYNEISMLYGVITEFCTDTTCPVMCAGPKYEYMWADGVRYKKPIRVSAPRYVELLMAWVEEQISDPRLFPTDPNAPFPRNFQQIIKTIFKRLFRVYGHIYHSHIQKVVQLHFEPHLNTCFKHFMYFVDEFNLIDRREQVPLQETIQVMFQRDKEKYSGRYRPNYGAGGGGGNAAQRQAPQTAPQ